MRSIKLTLTLSALAMGTALSVMPSFAQDYHYPMGRGVNDGGFGTVQNDNQSGAKTGQIAPRAPKGANMTDSGRGLYAYSGQAASQGAPQQNYKYSMGRNANDGGIATAQFDKGAERTGSTSSREAFRSGTESYSFGAQGQPPRTAPNTYSYTR
jgi:hypothetical protein